jgi:hypothetical protein
LRGKATIRKDDVAADQESRASEAFNLQETPSMSSREGMTWCRRSATLFEVECLEDRRLLSVVASAGARLQPLTAGGTNLGQNAAHVIAASDSSAQSIGSDLQGDSSGSGVSTADANASDGEPSGPQTQDLASTSGSAGQGETLLESSSSNAGEDLANPSSSELPATGDAVGHPGSRTASSIAAERTPTDDAAANKSSEAGSSIAAERTPADEATANRSSGTGPSGETPVSPADDGVSAALTDGSVVDEVVASAVSSAGTAAPPSGSVGDISATGADPLGSASARGPAPTMAASATLSSPSSDAPPQRDPWVEGKNSMAAGGEGSHVEAGSIFAVTAVPGYGSEVGSGPVAETIRSETESDGGSGLRASPRYSDLLVEFMPFDRASLENAIDRFLEGFETLGTELGDWPEPAGVVPGLVGTALTALAAEVTLRQQLARNEARRPSAEETEEELAGLAGFPHLWRQEES